MSQKVSQELAMNGDPAIELMLVASLGAVEVPILSSSGTVRSNGSNSMMTSIEGSRREMHRRALGG